MNEISFTNKRKILVYQLIEWNERDVQRRTVLVRASLLVIERDHFQ